MPQDPYASVAGIAGRVVLIHLMRTLIETGALTKSDAAAMLKAAAKELAAFNTEIATGGVGIVEATRVGLFKP